MRVEAAGEHRRLEIIHAARQQRIPARQKGEEDSRIGWARPIVDARKEAPDLIGIEKRTLVHALAPSRRR